MNSDQKILECVPNFSEGRDPEIIRTIAGSIQSVPGVCLLHIDVSPSANRTVMTFAGNPQQVTEAAFRAIETAGRLIDMRQQQGVHPRIGATDVCPLVPLCNMSMKEAVSAATQLGARVAQALNIPVYLYEYAAENEIRKSLPAIRKGQYEGLSVKMSLPEWRPDFGEEFNIGTGATIIGARDILVAFNVAINTREALQAELIARQMRESGYWLQQNGRRRHIPGMLPKLRAIGWYMADYNCAQVSFNLLDYRITSPLKVWEVCCSLAAQMGLEVTGSEVIGLIPEACLLEAGNAVLRNTDNTYSDKITDPISSGIDHLRLNYLKSFVPDEKILEYALAKAGLIAGSN